MRWNRTRGSSRPLRALGRWWFHRVRRPPPTRSWRPSSGSSQPSAGSGRVKPLAHRRFRPNRSRTHAPPPVHFRKLPVNRSDAYETWVFTLPVNKKGDSPSKKSRRPLARPPSMKTATLRLAAVFDEARNRLSMTAKTAAKTRVGGLRGEDRHSRDGGGLRANGRSARVPGAGRRCGWWRSSPRGLRLWSGCRYFHRTGWVRLIPAEPIML